MTELLAPNGKPSNLTPEQYKLVRSQSFKAWFGDWESKQFKNNHKPHSEIYPYDTIALDENGEPRIWHRATNYDYTEFDTEYIYLGSKKSYVKQYGKPKEFFIKPQKTIFIDNQDIERQKLGIKFDYLAEYISDENGIPRKGKNYDKLKKAFENQKEVLSVWEYFTFVGNKEILDLFKNWLNEYDFDSVMYWETGLKNNFGKYPVGLICLYFGNEIKLADGSNTTFDGKNSDIRFEEGGLTLSEVETRVDNFLQWFENNGWKELSQEEVINAGLGNVDDYFWIEGYTFQSPDKNVLLQFSRQARYILDKYGVFQKISSRYRDKEPIIMLDTLLVKEKGKGEGTKAIKLITELADKFGVILHLYSKPIPKMEYLNNKELFDFYKKAGFKVLKENEIQKIMVYNPDMRFNEGGEVIINPTEIECHKCHWHWKVKDGGDDLFICHKCYTDNSKYYKFEGLEGQKILDTISYAKGGKTISQTPAPKKDQIKGSDKNKEGSSKDLKSAKKIELSDKTIESIKNKVDKHNEKYPKKKITIDSAKAVVRRGMGAYSSSYRPTISGGKPNSRVAWGLARLNAFLYKIVNGKSKSGKYSQDNDLIEELGYKVQKFSDGGELSDFVLYHGTGNAKKVIEALKNDSFIFHKSAGVEDGINLTSNKKIALDYANDTNGEDIGVLEIRFNKIPNFKTYNNAGEQYYDEKKYSSNPKEASIEYKKDLIKNNYDGYSTGEVYVLFKEKIDLIDINKTSVLYNNADGGDIQAYEDAMGISEFDGGGETKAKKVYVSIPLKSDSRDILNEKGFWDGSRYTEFEEKTFQDLQNQKLIGIIGVSLSPHNVGEWFYHRNCLIVMKYEEFEKINDFTIIDYNNPEQLMADDMKLFNRIYGGKRDEMIDDEKLKGQRSNSLYNILKRFNKFIEIAIRKEPNHLTKQGLYRIQYFIDESYNFRKWINSNNYIINNPNDLAERIIEYHYSEDSNWISNFYGNTEDKNIDEEYIIPFVIEGVKYAGKIFKSEQEVYLNNKILNIPNDSQLFFKVEKEDKSNLSELIEKYLLEEKYRIHFVRHKDIQKYSLIASKKRDEQELKNIELEKEKLEIDKDRVLHQIFNLFLTESINSFRNQINKEISEYSDSNLFYLDNESEEYKEVDWYAIPLVQLIVNKYQEIVFNNWNKYVSSKNVKDVTIYAFSNFQTESYNDLKQFFEENKNELEKINDYRNINGGWLSEYRLEYWLKKSVDDYQDMPEWIDHKELAKLYLEKMDAKMYKYYTDTDIPLFSKYKDGGETDELILEEKTKKNTMNTNNPKDTITMNIPLLIRFSELMREDIKTDVALHEIVENLLDIKDKGVLTMDDYESVVGNVTGTEENTNTEVVEEEIMAEGGKVNSIKSKKGDIKVSLDENWYSDDTKVELVPVSELVKFREFDRKVKPKYNQDNSRDNINHLKYIFQKDGVKEPLIIEYSPQDNAVLVIEGNHRINSAMDLGMEYLPARVVLRKYSQFTPNQINNTMKVSGVTADNSGYISSDLKPSQIGIEGTMPIFADGGIIEGRLHSECDADEGCGRKFQVGENGHIIEAERDEAVIVADAFNDDAEYTIKGTPSEVASALNVMGGGKNFDKGAIIIKNGQELEIPELKKQAIDTDVDDIIDPSSIIINRRSMADKKQYEVTGTTKQIASAINSINGNGVVIERGAEIKEN